MCFEYTFLINIHLEYKLTKYLSSQFSNNVCVASTDLLLCGKQRWKPGSKRIDFRHKQFFQIHLSFICGSECNENSFVFLRTEWLIVSFQSIGTSLAFDISTVFSCQSHFLLIFQRSPKLATPKVYLTDNSRLFL